jgi:phosphatidylserine/phosphatidylglycerophosphate/cardiolipin synthase-like enzyme
MDQPLSFSLGHSAYASILAPGRNCGRIAKAHRAAVLVDSCEYFRRLEFALQQAEQSILIIGWDFDGRIKLCPDNCECQPLGHFLRSLVDRRPNLQIRMLVWSGAVVHAPGDPMPLIFGADWQQHQNIILKLDQHHPLYAAHHQKIVVIDDRIAFAGGIDLTVDRWDTCGHAEEDQFRVRPDGNSYRPVHDVQMLVDDDAAAAIGDVARERWLIATGEKLTAMDGVGDLWPPDLVPDFRDVGVGIARTVPSWGKTQSINEIARLTEDMLSAARDSVYIESQYLTASNVRRLMSIMLGARHGPEIAVLVKKSSPGTLERFAMGANRDRMIRHLRRADLHGRLRVYYPIATGKEGHCEILLHSKVLIVDDQLIRIGSSNLNNRSMGLDTECDLVVQATNGAQRGKIVEIRNRLLAEHLGVNKEMISTAVERFRSLIRGIDACNTNARGLRPFPETNLEGPTKPISATAFMDPAQPLKIL